VGVVCDWLEEPLEGVVDGAVGEVVEAPDEPADVGEVVVLAWPGRARLT
jgi:hypothetical protein